MYLFSDVFKKGIEVTDLTGSPEVYPQVWPPSACLLYRAAPARSGAAVIAGSGTATPAISAAESISVKI
jgi:hypothetical protein